MNGSKVEVLFAERLIMQNSHQSAESDLRSRKCGNNLNNNNNENNSNEPGKDNGDDTQQSWSTEAQVLQIY